MKQTSRDPLHGVTLQAIVETLVEHYGWEEMARRVDIKCFKVKPSVSSSLTFLRRTPWARRKVEQMYLQRDRAAARRERKSKRPPVST
jgi:uncharacterized protein (DUF2132 family)